MLWETSKLVHNFSRILPGFLLVLLALAPSAMAQTASPELLSNSPFDSCESSLNCVHLAYVFDIPPSSLASATLKALQENKHLDSLTEGTNRFDAVFNAWQYKDDVQIAIELDDEGSVLFIRSESREGTYDLGVNKRRVKGIINAIEKQL